MAFPPTKRFYKFLRSKPKTIFNYFWFCFLLLDILFIVIFASFGDHLYKSPIKDFDERLQNNEFINISININNIVLDGQIIPDSLFTTDSLEYLADLNSDNSFIININEEVKAEKINNVINSLKTKGFKDIAIKL